MSKYVWIGISLGLLSLSSAMASEYPPDYAYQTVRVVEYGSLIVAHVGSGVVDATIIGYKFSGPLAQGNPDSLDAVVSVNCLANDGSNVSRTNVVKLGREWQGAGYTSAPLSMDSLLPQSCRVDWHWSLGIAISDGRGHWDSRDGANYPYSQDLLWSNSPEVVPYATSRGAQMTLASESMIWPGISFAWS